MIRLKIAFSNGAVCAGLFPDHESAEVFAFALTDCCKGCVSIVQEEIDE